MTSPVSLIIVSRNRKHALRRVLRSLPFQTHPNFEVIVVADVPAAELSDVPGIHAVRLVHFDQANISAARNRGLAEAAGELIAFCDDDAVPEPMWLERLSAGFNDPDVGMAGGYVRGRNGLSYQWTALRADLRGEDIPMMQPDLNDVTVYPPDATGYVRVQGTNCAFRRAALEQVGGFDQAFRFFLDETDLADRMAHAGWKTALVPLAEVQHGFAESDERNAQRVPKSLFNIGASKAHFLRKRDLAPDDALPNLIHEQHKRLIRLMVSGRLSPTAVPRLLETLRDGFASVTESDVPQLGPRPAHAFQPYPTLEPRVNIAIYGNVGRFVSLARAARKLADRGETVTLYRYTHTALYHRRYFDPRGFWVQAGGLFGRSDRGDATFQFRSARLRTLQEIARRHAQHPDPTVLSLSQARERLKS